MYTEIDVFSLFLSKTLPIYSIIVIQNSVLDGVSRNKYTYNNSSVIIIKARYWYTLLVDYESKHVVGKEVDNDCSKILKETSCWEKMRFRTILTVISEGHEGFGLDFRGLRKGP